MGDSSHSYIDDISRGGLVEPSAFVFNVASHESQLFSFILNESALRKMFLATTNTYAVFEAVFKEQLEICREKEDLLTVQCARGHPAEVFVSRVVRTILNVGLKNFVSECNDKINSNRKRELGSNHKECSASKNQKKLIGE